MNTCTDIFERNARFLTYFLEACTPINKLSFEKSIHIENKRPLCSPELKESVVLNSSKLIQIIGFPWFYP